jgi:septal ring factor EnvC (AmiA/AmiB activator)
MGSILTYKALWAFLFCLEEGVDVEHRVNKLENEISNINGDIVDIKSRLAVAESNIKDIKEDLSSIKNNTAWILRLILGAIITGLFGLLFKGGI